MMKSVFFHNKNHFEPQKSHFKKFLKFDLWSLVVHYGTGSILVTCLEIMLETPPK